MQNFAILTDTACDMTAELRERFGIDGYVRGTLISRTATPSLLIWIGAT